MLIAPAPFPFPNLRAVLACAIAASFRCLLRGGRELPIALVQHLGDPGVNSSLGGRDLDLQVCEALCCQFLSKLILVCRGKSTCQTVSSSSRYGPLCSIDHLVGRGNVARRVGFRRRSGHTFFAVRDGATCTSSSPSTSASSLYSCRSLRFLSSTSPMDTLLALRDGATCTSSSLSTSASSLSSCRS